ncbi:hypothetical protein LCGC14_0408610 [marine sediment metagenome]|uniref:Uncharacterized protein n=1 Tax=marine sediment metagenome TaxID=412755 RepID=A0A0F9T052_9ZZZZ
METEPDVKPGGSGGEGDKTTPTLPRVEVKDGATFLDGKKVVLESDLIAAKNSLEGQLKTAQTTHETAIDTAKLENSESQKQIAILNAKIQENEQARESGAVPDEEAARIKTELETAKSSIVSLTADAGRALELRRANMLLQYGVALDTIVEKDMKALDSFEEAIKALATAKGGVGNYATGGGTGEAAPQTAIERATAVIAATSVRGVRNADMQ